MHGLNETEVVTAFLTNLTSSLWDDMDLLVGDIVQPRPVFKMQDSILGQNLLSCFRIAAGNEEPLEGPQEAANLILQATYVIARIAAGNENTITPQMILEHPFWYLWALSRIWAIQTLDDCFTMTDLADLTDTPRTTLQSHNQRGNLPGYFDPNRGQHFYRWTDVQAVIQSNKQKGRPTYGIR